MNIQNLQEVLTRIQQIDGLSEAAIVGGAVRDTVYGITPLDYDIYVPVTGSRWIHRAATILNGLANQGLDGFLIPNYGVCNEFNELWHCVIKTTLEGKQLDILLAKSDLISTVAQFDCNLNQYIYTQDYLSFPKVSPEKKLIFKHGVNKERAQYMLDKWLEYVGIKE